MDKTVNIVNKHSGKETIAVYTSNSKGNMRYNVGGKFLTDKQFDQIYTIYEKGNKNTDSR